MKISNIRDHKAFLGWVVERNVFVFLSFRNKLSILIEAAVHH
jgi:hypothetical protein